MSDSTKKSEDATGLPIADTASIEYHHSVPYPRNNDAFLYTNTILSTIARTLRPGDEIVIDLYKDTFVTVDVKWRPHNSADEKPIKPDYYSLGSIGKTVHPAAQCIVQVTLSQERTETKSILTVPATDKVAPVLAFDVGDEDETIGAEQLPAPHKAREEEYISRITRVEQPTIQMDEHVSEFLDSSLPTETSGPRTNKPLSERSLPSSDTQIEHDIQTIPKTFCEVGRCPICQHAIVPSIQRQRVVCVGCRRWCTLDEWFEYASDDPATRIAIDTQ